MAYIRKTKDEYNIVTNYGYGWETECTEDNIKEAKVRAREYLENTHARVRIEKKRIKINDN